MSQQSRTNDLEWIDRTRQSIAFLDEESLLTQIRGIVREEVVAAIQNEKIETFHTIKETCELLKISESTFHRWKRDGILRVVGKGAVVRVPQDEIERMLLNSRK